jgi:hypothetical protein
MHIRRNSRMNCFNSVFTGYPVGIILDNERGNTQGAATNGDLVLQNIYFAQMGLTVGAVTAGGVGADNNSTNNSWSGDFSKTHIEGTPGYKYYNTVEEIGLKDFRSKVTPVPPTGIAANNPSANWGPTASSPLRAAGAANFSHSLLNDPFFIPVTYAGAFASDSDADNWTKGWANFDPQNTDY